jgi:hypothetical protein
MKKSARAGVANTVAAMAAANILVLMLFLSGIAIYWAFVKSLVEPLVPSTVTAGHSPPAPGQGPMRRMKKPTPEPADAPAPIGYAASGTETIRCNFIN